MTPDILTPSRPGGMVARTVHRSDAAGQGRDGAYYRLAEGDGEPHLRRLELAPGTRPEAPAPGRRTSLLHVACVTDLHVLDPESPVRFEFVDRFHGPAALHLLVPAYRPQEFLQAHACEAMLRTLSAITGSPATGAPLRFLLCLGDHVDNAQLNELRRVVGLLEGGAVTPGSGGPAYEGVASVAWGDPAYWHPDPGDDEYKARWGFPTYPDLLVQARAPFQAQGVALPWLCCRGNHDALVQGTALFTGALERIAVGPRKARALPPDFALMTQLDRYIHQPEAFLAGPTAEITPDAERRHVDTSEFVRTLAGAGGEPAGHGFTPRNLAEGTAYYVDDRHPPVRLIVLDTVNSGGNYQGSIGAAQLAWLEQRLIEVHGRYWDAAGRPVATGHDDRLVVLCSHHGLASLVNDLVTPGVETDLDLPRVLGPQVEALLHRFPNVILWVNGHTHYNTVRPRPDPAGRSAGFWEVTTPSLLDWPCQARLVEIVANGNGTLSIVCTMVDHAAPADPGAAEGLWRLAALHRELAANDPHAGPASGHQGQPSDRNVELVIGAPFPLP